MAGYPFERSNVSHMIGFSKVTDEIWSCQHDYPALNVNVGGAVGGTFSDGSTIVCGGFNGYISTFEQTCYSFTSTSSDVVKIEMTTQRQKAAGAVFEGSKLFIVGGYWRTDQ